MSTKKRWLVYVFALLILLGAGFFAMGGRMGLMLFYVKNFVRIEHGPSQDVSWQAGPSAPRADASTLGPDGRRRPNVVLIVADDLGFNDITFNGGGIANGSVPTPFIDSIGREGVDCHQGYSGNATCAPSRASIMTGRYATRFGFEFTPTPPEFMKMIGNYSAPNALRKPSYRAEREPDLIEYRNMGLPKTEITLGKLMGDAGYHTVHIGKWHLGESPQFRPYASGFKESLSLLHAASMFLPENDANVVNSKQDFDPIDKFLWAVHEWGIRFNDGKPFKPPKYLTDYLTDEAVKVVQANKNRPFFLYLAYNAPHTPLQATKEDYDALSHIPDHTMRVYAAMIRSLDRNIGRVLQSLKDQGVDDNTLVIFTSDNGGAHYIGLEGINSPYRGWKATFFDGGIHVPYFLRWPNNLPRGASYTAPVSHFDIFATAAGAAGIALPTDRPIDGVNLLPFLKGTARGQPHQQLFWRTDSYLAMRAGNWKLQVTEKPKQDWLYNLAVDPGEKNNLAATDPQKTAAMKADLLAWNKTQRKPLWPSMADAPVPVDKTLKAPQAKEDVFVYYGN